MGSLLLIVLHDHVVVASPLTLSLNVSTSSLDGDISQPATNGGLRTSFRSSRSNVARDACVPPVDRLVDTVFDDVINVVSALGDYVAIGRQDSSREDTLIISVFFQRLLEQLSGNRILSADSESLAQPAALAIHSQESEIVYTPDGEQRSHPKVYRPAYDRGQLHCRH
jgi:hypothetical protein